MPWRETCAMDERMRFIVEHERDEVGMAEVCRAHGISRKTGSRGWSGTVPEGSRGSQSDRVLR